MKSAYIYVLCLFSVLFMNCQRDVRKNHPHVNDSRESLLKSGSDEEREAQLLKEIHNAKLYMVLVAKSASVNAITVQAKHLADSVFKNEARLNTRLQEITARRNITLAVDLPREELRKIEKLNRLDDKQGGGFDREFALQVKTKTSECIKNLQELQRLADESDLREWAKDAEAAMTAENQLADNTWELVKTLKGKENPLTKEALR